MNSRLRLRGLLLGSGFCSDSDCRCGCDQAGRDEYLCGEMRPLVVWLRKKKNLKGQRVILTYFTSVKWGAEKMTMVFRGISNRDQTDEPTEGAFIPCPPSSASPMWTCVWITGGLVEFGLWFTAGLVGSGRRCPCCEWPGARGKAPALWVSQGCSNTALHCGPQAPWRASPGVTTPSHSQTLRNPNNHFSFASSSSRASLPKLWDILYYPQKECLEKAKALTPSYPIKYLLMRGSNNFRLP